jgi:hypothetical protein
MRLRGSTEGLAVVLAATALAIALTYPVAFNFGRIGRVNTDDGRWSIWVVSWVAHALTSNPVALYHANIFYPHRYALAFSEANLGAGVIGAPVWLLTRNPYATHNVAFLAAFGLAFVGAYYLTRYLVADRRAAFVAGILFAFCPFMFARTAHIQLLFIGLIPFCMLAFHRLVDSPTTARAATLGALISATSLTCAYYGIFAALAIGLGTLLYAGSRRLWRSAQYWSAVGLAAFTSIGLTLPFFLPYLRVQEETGFVRTLDDAREYSANAGAWLASAAWAHRWWLPRIPDYNEVLFPGILVLVLGCVGIHAMRQQRDTLALYLLIAVIAFWSSFGPDAGLYRVAYETVPIFGFLRAPSRMGILVTLSFVVFAAAGIHYLLKRSLRPLFVTVALSVLAVAELTTAPLSQFRIAEPFPAAYRMLRTLPRGPVAEFPYWYERHDFPRHAQYMLNSTTHWQPLVNGYSDHIPADFRRSVRALSTFPSREAFFALARADTRYVVFHLDMYNARLRERLFERLETYSPYLRPIVQEGPVWLFEIVDWPN